MTESAAGTSQSAGRKPGDILPQIVHGLAPAALNLRTNPAESVLHTDWDVTRLGRYATLRYGIGFRGFVV